MVDLVTQYERLKTDIDQAIQQVIEQATFINGPDVKTFQSDLEKYLNVPYTIPCANGTDALQIAMMGLGLKSGDEVITASFTYVATAEVIALLGLTPVLVDVYPNTFTLDLDAVEKAITPRTKAIVPVHLFGQCADMEPLLALAQKHQLYVIEDTAQAIGSLYTFSDGRQMQAGTMGTVGTTSFFPSKNLGCYGDGGAMMTRDEALAKKLRMICNHGQSQQYYHDVVGVNSRLDTLQAAILKVKLKQLDDFAARRQALAAEYDQAFSGIAGITTPYRNQQSTHVFHQYTLKLEGIDRAELKAHLESKGIPSMIYYPVALHMQKAYQSPQYQSGMFPVTEKLVTQVLSLPMHTEMTTEQKDLIIASVLEFCQQTA